MASGGGSSLVPVLPPFLTKCYDMVDDPSTDDTVSWSKTSNSFVIWDPHAFSQDLLPKYFKHSNLSSFVRQLNTYGFHKVDPDRWEFANEGFLRGQKHLLKTIARRKPAHNNIVPPPQQPHRKTESVNGIIEVGNFGFEEEIEILKRDKNALMQELIKVRQHQQNSELELHSLVRRIRCMEQKQLEMMSLLAMVVQTPNFIAQLVQQNVNDRWSNINKRRRQLPPPEHNVLEGAEAVSDGQMIKYQPFAPEIMKSSFLPVANSKESGSVFNDLHSNGVSMTVGDDLALPLQENGSLTNLEDLEQLLASSAGENSEQIEPGALAEYMRSLDFTEQETDGYMGNLTSEKGSNNMVVW